MWETDVACAGRVEYGPGARHGAVATDDRNVTIHEVAVDGLMANSLYHYRVVSGDAASDDCMFRTAPPPGVRFRFAAYGDTRSQPAEHARVVKRIIASRPRLVIHAGDIVGNGNNYDEWKREFFDPAAPLISRIPMALALGNHENNSHWYYDFCSNPTDSGSEAWYTFRFGDARFICVDSCQDYGAGSKQCRWLEETLAAPTDAIWTVVYFHHPPYASGGHKGNDKVAQHLSPLFERYDVDIVFNGHCHNYERSVNNGVVYVTTGGGGAPLAGVNNHPNPHQVYAESLYHHCVIDIDGGRLTCRGVRADNGEEFDEFTLTRTPAGRSEKPLQ
jgi:3',5'-cyclic AMP phosphodiesterase CpdA